MKITCTRDEKRRLTTILKDTDWCPFIDEDEKCLEDDNESNQFSCTDCMKKRILWDIPEEDGGKTNERTSESTTSDFH